MDDDDEFGEPKALVHLEDGAQIDIGLARARFHFDREVHRLERGIAGQRRTVLHCVQIAEDFVIEQRQAVSIAHGLFGKRELARNRGRSDGESGSVDLLPDKQVAHRLDRGELVRKVSFELELHQIDASRSTRLPTLGRMIAATFAFAAAVANPESRK